MGTCSPRGTRRCSPIRSRGRGHSRTTFWPTALSTPSTSRGSNTGEVFERDGRLFFRLFCVVKYKTKEYSGENAGMLEFE